MKITLGGVTRTLDLECNVTFRQAQAIQDYTGLAVFAWEERISGFGDATQDDFKADPAGTLKRMPMFADPEWIKSVAAACWLMLAQAGEEPAPLGDFDCDVLGFYLAFLEGAQAEQQAEKVPDKPDPTARPGRRAQSSRQTAPRKPKTIPGEVVRPLPRTGS